MKRVFDNVLDLIGNTPLIELKRLAEGTGIRLFGKLEGHNPGGSVKDRTALSMVETAEREGKLTPGKTVLVEPTSGNTGVALALVALAKGYRLKLPIPESMSDERKKLLSFLGAELELTPASEGMKGAIDRAEALLAELEDGFICGQFDNPANPAVHYSTTGPEIYEALEGKVDVFVAGVGTGGTLSGCGRYLKEQNPDVVIVAVEPAESPVISGGEPAPHGIQGIGAGFLPKVLDLELIDRIVCVTTEEAIATSRRLARLEGVMAGISSGAAVAAALQLAELEQFKGKQFAVILPDGAERYLSTALFEA